MLSTANANRAKGHLTDGDRTWEVYANDQLLKADEYRGLIVTYRNGAAVQLSDVADVQDSVEDLRNAGLTNGKPAVLIIIYRQPAANIIETVDRVRGRAPAAAGLDPRGDEPVRGARPHHHHPRLAARRGDHAA